MKDFVRDLNARLLEEAYAKVLGGILNGGFNDGGKDVLIFSEDFPNGLQVKSSIHFAQEHVTRGVKFRKFIPVAVGEPGTAEEIMDSIQRFGAWVEKGISGRDHFLECVAKARSMIS